MMPGPKPLSVILSKKQRGLLERLKRRQTSPQRLVRRVDTILAAADGANNESIAHQLGLNPPTVWTWRQRWRAGAEALDA